MFSIEALHPDGWHRQGVAQREYWACQEAQIRCCSDGRHYRICELESQRLVALINPSSCRTAPPPPTAAPFPAISPP